MEENYTKTTPPTKSYIPAVHHWFYKRLVGSNRQWSPFSYFDSVQLESSLTMNDDDHVSPNIVAVEGGRYDVNVRERIKIPVYWPGEPIEVRRCSWFYKNAIKQVIPYDERTSQLLETAYKEACECGIWRQKIYLSANEEIVFHGPTELEYFQHLQKTDSWGGTSKITTQPRTVKRDLSDFTIDQGEWQHVDHLIFLVHGIGSSCCIKKRSIQDVVDDFRKISQQLIEAQYKKSIELGLVGRVEVLPITWHSHFRAPEFGIDEKLKSITLKSIPILRKFTNDTLLDILFYTSPTYCQKIMSTVAFSLNTVYTIFCERNPNFKGGISLAGHSLGSVILFDLLCHQQPSKKSSMTENWKTTDMHTTTSDLDLGFYEEIPEKAVVSKQISYILGPAGTGQPFINYARLMFQPKKFFALGSPIGIFVTIRGIDKLGLDFCLPTCPGFYNIFHPLDPVAYRMEALINPAINGIRPVQLPHHKGRKRMHLQLRDTVTRVGTDMKHGLLSTVKRTFRKVNFLGSPRANKENDVKESVPKELDELLKMQKQLDQAQAVLETPHTCITEAIDSSTSKPYTDILESDISLGKLNESKRIDYVLQEAPLEFLNEYLFALRSHVGYWDSEDTILFLMKEIYASIGISPDSKVTFDSEN